jgi:hypothetical protein
MRPLSELLDHPICSLEREHVSAYQDALRTKSTNAIADIGLRLRENPYKFNPSIL